MARAIWKGIVRIGKVALPVKLYSAVQDRSVHFRLLHARDREPVRQQLVSSATGKPVDRDEVRKAYPVGSGRLVVLEEKDLDELQPEESRDIVIRRFVDPEEIDHRWYERAYYLGPDGDEETYFTAVEALGRRKKEGVARWVMRKKEYVGSLREEEGYLMLIVLRHAEEVVSAENLEAPGGRSLDKREIAMAEQLLEALEGRFEPQQFADEYRNRVMELVETKARGGKVKVKAFRPKKTEDEALTGALRASLAGARKKAGRG